MQMEIRKSKKESKSWLRPGGLVGFITGALYSGISKKTSYRLAA